ncbi:MAG: PD-(D/E)XK nuclease family protein [Clostridiales bacterium]|nr:PD-(D/E)XK nuclease family protein [Clostridiales bacterium]
MELNFITGRSQAAGTEYCIDKMLSLPQSQRIFYIVPEQFTLESEKALVAKRNSLLNIDVVSFNRLRFHLSALDGKIDREFLDDEAKSMILRRITEGLSLELFKGLDGRQGFLDSIESVISEFYRFKISPSKLKENLSKLAPAPENTSFLKKMNEISAIYEAYDSFVSEKYIFSDSILDIVAEQIKHSSLFDGSAVFIDGFNSFTKQELGVIKEIFAFAESVSVSLCYEGKIDNTPSDPLTDPFYETKTTALKLRRIFTEVFPEGGKINTVETQYEDKKLPPFSHLEKYFFDYPPKVFKGGAPNIRQIAAVNKKAEVSAVCDEILSLTESNMRYRDIAIILCDTSYMPLLKSALKSRGLPDFTDTPLPISTHPCIRFILSLIKTAEAFHTRDILTLLKTELTKISAEKAYALERFAAEYGIEGFKWQSEFKNSYFEAIRKDITDMVSPLRELFAESKEAKVSDLNKALFECIEKSGFYGKYKTLAENETDPVLSSRHKQVWEQAVSTFDKAEEFLGDTSITLETFGKILESGFAKKSTATIPLYQDSITIGDVNRSRLPKIKALFIVGANKGSLPKAFPDDGLLSDSERAALKEMDMEIAADTKEQLSLEYLKIYQIMTKPSERLYLTYSLGTNEGGPLEPSEIVEKLITIFKTPVEVYSDKAISPENTDVFEPKEEIAPELTEKLLGTPLTLSASKLESYSQCPFSFFLTYVLRLKENKVFDIDPLDRGNIIHSLLEEFFKAYPDVNNIDEEKIDGVIASLMPELIKENCPKLLDDEGKVSEELPVMKYRLRLIEKIAAASVKAAVSQLKAGDFVPSEFEAAFGEDKPYKPIDLGDGISLVGKIDRVDICEKNGASYIKITDYKGSAHSVDSAEIANGTSLQLPLYLLAYTEEKKKEQGADFRPAALVYFTYKDPILTDNKITSAEEADACRKEKYELSGIVSNKAFAFLNKSDIGFTNKLEVKTEEELYEILKTAKDVSFLKGRELQKGFFPVRPYKYGNKDGCAYCPYDGICKINIDKSKFKDIEKE